MDLSTRINQLFEVEAAARGRAMSNAAAAQAITERTGVSISATYLWQLRTGVKNNPTLTHLRAIADFFEVPVHRLIGESSPGHSPHPMPDAVSGDVTSLLRGPGPLWHVSGLIRLDPTTGESEEGVTRGENLEDIARAAGESARAAIIAWLMAAERAADAHGGKAAAGTLSDYLPGGEEVEMGASRVWEGRRAAEELVGLITISPKSDG